VLGGSLILLQPLAVPVFQNFPKTKKLGTIEKTLGFWGFLFIELEKDNLLQSRVFEKSQRTWGFLQ